MHSLSSKKKGDKDKDEEEKAKMRGNMQGSCSSLDNWR